MKQLLASILFIPACLAGPGTIVAVEEIHERVDRVTINSAALGVGKDVIVVRPAGYEGLVDEWPVVYLLHGKGRSETSLITNAAHRATLQAARFVTVLPDGDNSWYVNSAAGNYADYMSEVMTIVETAYNVGTVAAARGLTGWSMGGYGAVRFAQRHRECFAAVAPVIGVIDYPSRGRGREVADFPDEARIFGADTNLWAGYNPVNDVRRLQGMAVHLIAGDADAITRTMNENFHQALVDAGIDHSYTILPGGHSFALVAEEALPLVVKFMEAELTHE